MPNFCSGDSMLKKLKKLKAVQLYITFCDIFTKYEISQTASSIAYFLLLSFFPFLVFLAALIGFLNLPAEALKQTLAPFFTQQVYDTVISYHRYFASVSNGFSLLFGFVFSLYAASRAVHALMHGMYRVFGEGRTHSIIKEFLICIGFTLGMAIAVVTMVFIVGVTGTYFSPLTVAFPWLNRAVYVYFIGVVMIFVLLCLFYSLAPAKRVPLKDTLLGSLLCIVGLHAVSIGVGIYARISSRFSVLYGSIGAVIILLLWLYFFGICILLGALVNKYCILKKRGT